MRALLGDHYDADVALTPDAPSARYKLALMSRVLAEFRRTADSAGVPMALLVIPTPIDACDNFGIPIDTTRYRHYDRTRLSAAIETMAHEQAIHVVDLYAPYRAHPSCDLYFKKDDHWNNAGQAMAARLMADSLSHWGLWK